MNVGRVNAQRAAPKPAGPIEGSEMCRPIARRANPTSQRYCCGSRRRVRPCSRINGTSPELLIPARPPKEDRTRLERPRRFTLTGSTALLLSNSSHSSDPPRTRRMGASAAVIKEVGHVRRTRGFPFCPRGIGRKNLANTWNNFQNIGKNVV